MSPEDLGDRNWTPSLALVALDGKLPLFPEDPGQRTAHVLVPEGEGVELFPDDPFPDYSADPVMDYDVCANG